MGVAAWTFYTILLLLLTTSPTLLLTGKSRNSFLDPPISDLEPFLTERRFSTFYRSVAPFLIHCFSLTSTSLIFSTSHSPSYIFIATIVLRCIAQLSREVLPSLNYKFNGMVVSSSFSYRRILLAFAFLHAYLTEVLGWLRYKDSSPPGITRILADHQIWWILVFYISLTSSYLYFY